MTSGDRDQWLTILETASQSLPDEINEHWDWLMDQLDLPHDLFHAVFVAIQQGRWRAAKNPKSYIKTVARREAKKLEPIPSDQSVVSLIKQPKNGKVFSFDEALDRLSQSGSSEPSKREDGIWRRGNGDSDDYFEDENDPRAGVSFREFLLSHVPQELKHVEPPSAEYKALIDAINEQTTDYHYQAHPSTHLDWDRWTAAAGFDRWDRLVLSCKLNQISRDRALADQPIEEDRKALQAAWRRFDRTGISRLKEAAKKFGKKCPGMHQTPH